MDQFDLTPRTIFAAQRKHLVAATGQGVIGAGLWWLSRGWPTTGANLAETIVLLLMLGMLMSLCLALQRLPRLLIDQSGITFASAFRTRHWAWDDVGPFVIAYARPTDSDWPGIYACAHTKRYHYLLNVLGKETISRVSDADIRIPLGRFALADSRDDALALARVLNKWRQYYGYPQVEIGLGDPALQLETLANKRTLRRYWPWVILGGAVAAFVVYQEVFAP